MNKWQGAVAEFHRATGQDDTLATPEARLLRAKLIMEEAVETVAALGFSVVGEIYRPGPVYKWEEKLATFDRSYDEYNHLDFIDGMCDLIYVTCGGAVNASVDLDRHFEEVQRANMDKLTGPKRADGKQLKPANWRGPDHQRIIDLYYPMSNGGCE